MTLNQLISLMFDIKTFYLHELECTNLVVIKTLGYEETSLLSSLLLGCDWSFVKSDTYVYCDIDPHLYLVVVKIIV